MRCPKCQTKATLHEISSGGDDLYMCPKCSWVEDPTLNYCVCKMCDRSLRKDTAMMDAKWEEFSINGELIFICRECAKLVAEAVVGEY